MKPIRRQLLGRPRWREENKIKWVLTIWGPFILTWHSYQFKFILLEFQNFWIETQFSEYPSSTPFLVHLTWKCVIQPCLIYIFFLYFKLSESAQQWILTWFLTVEMSLTFINGEWSGSVLVLSKVMFASLIQSHSKHLSNLPDALNLLYTRITHVWHSLDVPPTSPSVKPNENIVTLSTAMSTLADVGLKPYNKGFQIFNTLNTSKYHTATDSFITWIYRNIFHNFKDVLTKKQHLCLNKLNSLMSLCEFRLSLLILNILKSVHTEAVVT